MITSRTNDKIKYIEKLKQKSSFRREEGCFIVEGIRMVREVPVNLRRELYLTEKALADHPELAVWCGAVETVSDSVMEKLADTKTPQGMLAVVRIPEWVNQEGHALNEGSKNEGSKNEGSKNEGSKNEGSKNEGSKNEGSKNDGPERDEIRNNGGVKDGKTIGIVPLYLVLDGVQDPGNVGTLIRTAEAVGATAVLLSRTSADPFSPKVVRSTMGTIFRVRVEISDNLPATLRELKKEGVRIFGTHLSGTEFYDADLTVPLAFLIGNEGNGLTDEVAAEADSLLRIPMEGHVESLNAAVSGSVVAYEAYRQRKKRM